MKKLLCFTMFLMLMSFGALASDGGSTLCDTDKNGPAAKTPDTSLSTEGESDSGVEAVIEDTETETP